MIANPTGAGYRTSAACRMCGSSNLAPFIDLGTQPPANALLTKEDLAKPEAMYPLRVLVCGQCSLVQLGEIVDPETLFSQYLYFSAGMPASKHFREYAEDVTTRFTAKPDELVVEIGSNDGHFLEIVKEKGRRILGVDPAQNIAKMANERGIPTIADFFSQKIAEQIVQQHGYASLMVGNNVVAHIADYDDLLLGVSKLLADDGVFVFEAPYLIDMFENMTFDTIYHEHLSYLSVRPLVTLFDKYGLEVFDVELHPIQGQSIRVFTGRKGKHPIAQSVSAFTNKELEMKLNTTAPYEALATQIAALRDEVVTLLHKLKSEGKTIAGYGAPAKGNTLLNYYAIGTDLLDFATETLPSKIGLYTPGMHIRIVDIKWAQKHLPDYFFLLAWNYKAVILAKETKFKENGGKFILPIGSERIV